MKRIISIVAVICLLAVTLIGCNSTKNDSDTLSGTVTTDGSTSMEKVMEYLREYYMEENSDVTVSYSPTGSSAGIEAVKSGSCDIGLASRDLKGEEKEELVGTVVAIDGIAIVVNPENPVNDLTLEQIAALYTGEITNWKELGGEDTPVVIIGRDAASGTRDGFESITGTKDACVYNQELTSTGDVIQTVASNPNAIGYASLASVKDSVKAIKVEGVEASSENIQNGSYRVQRNFIFVTRKDKELTGAAKAFFEFATSEAADELLIEAGVVPVAR